MLLTAAVLGRGFYAFVVGKPLLSQRMMRWRVLAQGGTVLAVAWGLYMKVQWSSHTDAATAQQAGPLPAPRAIDKQFFFDHAVEANSEVNRHLLPAFKGAQRPASAPAVAAVAAPEPRAPVLP